MSRFSLALRIQTACLILCLSAGIAWAQNEPRKVALLVGVNRYENVGFRDLDYAERDVTELGKVLKDLGFEVRVLTASAAGESKATLANIEKTLSQTLQGLKKNDLLIIGLAGHGFQLEVPTVQGKLEATPYFCPFDAKKGVPATMLSLSSVLKQMDPGGARPVGAGTNLLLVDACREDPSRGRGIDGGTVKTLPKGVAALLGCEDQKQSFESEKAGGGHGIFFHSVIEGLKGEAADRDGDITWQGLAAYVTKSVPKNARAWADREQKPNLISNTAGAPPVLARVKLPDVRLPSPDPLPLRPGDRDDEKGKPLTLDLGGGVKLVTLKIKSGKFTMGSPASEAGRGSGETQKSVTIDKDFYMGESEVTQAQWKAVMGTTPWKGETYVKEGDAYPANYVSWDDAQAFMEKVSKLTGKKVRLPSEAEWEYACRAGTTTAYSFGDSDRNLSDYAWYYKNAYAIGEEYAHEVKTKKPNPWGLYDMHGNVWEWCEDRYGTASRVLRGGCWYSSPVYCRSAARYRGSPVNRNGYGGFRVVLDF